MRKSRALTAEVLTKRGADRLAALLLDAVDHDAALARPADRSVAQGGVDSAAVVIDADIKRLKRIKHEERASALPLGTAAPELRKIDCARQPRRDARPARNVVSERTRASANCLAFDDECRLTLIEPKPYAYV